MSKRDNADERMSFFKFAFVLFLYSAVILFVCIFSRSYSENYCRTISSYLRYFVSAITGVFHFSVAELLVFLLPPLWILYELLKVFRKKFSFKRFLRRIFSIVFVLFFLFVNTFGVCYTRRPLEENVGFSVVDISKQQLVESAEYISRELERNIDNIDFDDTGASVNPHNWDLLNEKIDNGYDRLIEEYSFISDIDADAKPISVSFLMTYTHISGIFMPFTAEANVNTNYPDYVVAFSMAHEKAHQRGIAGEDEANFVAFLSCLASDDNYLVYSALLSMFEYYLDAIYRADKNVYFKLLKNTDIRVIGEMYAYSVFFDKYRDSSASKVADVVNDSYIKTMGDVDGVDSYGRVVELCTSYLMQKQALPY